MMQDLSDASTIIAIGESEKLIWRKLAVKLHGHVQVNVQLHCVCFTLGEGTEYLRMILSGAPRHNS
ncbi:hypothetical protein BDQ94DRAFT_140421 [Aspergillus welwitschiae]|uniref:Uncharacterized protein n=1 Tax=Aspergillus welwitschiae TaxID=1341132 RepID=A0A3F3Q7X7_9EURO|nr:hypothetical protein BDQ94DRAFT_140421 [Aspergillus welwitschiae]RDH35219.1 hypothetical protein BDQ94DRAFT_140421 [Aspergillus welwitschiae]